MVNVNTKKAMPKNLMFPSWADLHCNLLELIIDKLIPIRDRICFGAVCLSWYSVFCENRLILPIQLPLLTLAPGSDTYNYRHTCWEISERTLYTIGRSRFHHLQFPIDTKYSIFCSSKGWLLMSDISSSSIRLVNPFLSVNNTIDLPPLTSTIQLHCRRAWYGHCLSPHKVVMSADPFSSSNTESYSVMLIYGNDRKMAYFRAGDAKWTEVKGAFYIHDVLYYKNKFYSIDCIGLVCVYDNIGKKHFVCQTHAIVPLNIKIVSRKYYLVESLGELLLVRRSVRAGPCLTCGFEVFKHDPTTSNWVKVESLSNKMLFLGDNSSFAISTLDFPAYKPNCIFFTSNTYYHDLWRWPSHMGVFDLADGSFKNSDVLEQERFPIFIEPKLH
ncbi:hypothetical protein GIB67_015842 [Kingdonia uniflora]|uniref:KIB1-4 beta-propeller domain-containing protein n=1 Tax=Kingdonia uniflora TaxID=39325 RepID=A0A7J7NE54_9MAGN|nr:hypothetical protein GIB67_015842 [Kingdonia uniflora]